MEQKDLAAAIGKPQIARLKQIGSGIRVGQVLGARVLVKTVTARTDLDRVEEQGLIKIPIWVKKENTPLPTTGIVLLVGPEVACRQCGRPSFDHKQDWGGDCESYDPFVHEGDMVMYPKFSGSDFQIEEEDLRIMEAAEILCTLVDTQEALVEVPSGNEENTSH